MNQSLIWSIYLETERERSQQDRAALMHRSIAGRAERHQRRTRRLRSMP